MGKRFSGETQLPYVSFALRSTVGPRRLIIVIMVGKCMRDCVGRCDASIQTQSRSRDGQEALKSVGFWRGHATVTDVTTLLHVQPNLSKPVVCAVSKERKRAKIVRPLFPHPQESAVLSTWIIYIKKFTRYFATESCGQWAAQKWGSSKNQLIICIKRPPVCI